MELAIHNIDLHYHAGSERRGSSLRDYIDHARMTGRLVLGVTDHLGRYSPERCRNPYGPGAEGIKLFREDLEQVAPEFPEMRLLLGPEVAFERVDKMLSQEIAEISDFLIIEPPRIYASTDRGENTENWIAGVRKIAEVAERFEKPVHMAHPFREASNNRLIENPIERRITEMPLREDCDFSDEEVNWFFMMDVRALGRALAEHGVATEVSGDTVARTARISLPACRQILWAGYRILRNEGVDLLPASDHHVIADAIGRVGTPVPSEVFQWLGIGAGDLQHLRKLCPDLTGTSDRRPCGTEG